MQSKLATTKKKKHIRSQCTIYKKKGEKTHKQTKNNKKTQTRKKKKKITNK